MSRDFVLSTGRGEKLNVTTFGENNPDSCSCLIFVHGFKGFKNWGFGPYTAEYFSKKGYFVITFNFSHNGIGENLTEFTELEKFAQNTFSLEIEELNELIDALNYDFFGKRINKSLGLLGHSRGGAIAILTAHKRADVKAVSIWSSVSNFDRYTKRQKEEWRKKGKIRILNTRTRQLMNINSSLLEDLEINKNGSLNIENAVKNINRPLLIVHGEQDLAVKFEEAKQMYNWADKNKTELFAIPSAGHTFDIKHPFEGSNTKFDSVVSKTAEFFNKNLS